MKKIFTRCSPKSLIASVLIAVGMSALPAIAGPSEREEIVAVLRELEFIRERVQAMSRKHAQNREKIRFNYQALLDQLRATENGIRAYLNAQIDVIHTQPPKPVDQQLYRVRKN